MSNPGDWGYAKPISVAPGEQIELKISGAVDFDLTVRRVDSVDAAPIGQTYRGAEHHSANVQSAPADAWSNGCSWSTTAGFAIPDDWPSGLYTAECTGVDGSVGHVLFVVRPDPARRGDLAVLVNCCTWNAYNGWGGISKYDGATQGSFERPFGGSGNPLADGNVNHTARAESWVLNWLDPLYGVDVYADFDLDSGAADLSSYKAVLLSTHPEYWTLPMLDALEAFVAGGGSLHYLGGNGLFERCEFTADRSALTFWGGNSSQPRARNFLRNLNPPRPERELLGVAFRFNNYLTDSKPRPLEVHGASHRFFRGTVGAAGGELTNGELVGGIGRNIYSYQDPTFGAASGWEMDGSTGASAPDGVIVNCWDPTGPDYADGGSGTDRGNPPTNIQLLARGTNSEQGPHAADMTYYDHPGGGFVFAAGSITFGGSLVEDSNLQTIVKNAIDDSLGWVDPKGTIYAAVWEQVGGPTWQARHGLTADEHQTLFNDLVAQGYRQTAISGYGVDGDAYYASIWEQSGGPAWQARHGLDAAQHQAAFDDLSAQGYREFAISGYSLEGQPHFASLWVQTDGPAWQARHGLTADQHQQLFNDLSGQGYRLISISNYPEAGEVHYASIWEQAGGVAWQARHGLSADDHQSAFDELTAEGFRQTAVSVCTVGDDQFYSSIWEQNDGTSWQARHGISAADYQRNFNRLARQGYRLRAVCGSDPDFKFTEQIAPLQVPVLDPA